MPRYILIDHNSGYIYGDTADMQGQFDTPIEAARACDDIIGSDICQYDEIPRTELTCLEFGYHIYRADIGGSEAVPVVVDGQDQETIDNVIEHCEYVVTVRCERGER